MNRRILRSSIGIALAAGVLAFAGAARADGWRPAGSLDLAAVPVVEVTPAPAFERITKSAYEHDWALPRAEHDRARAFDGAHAERARFEEPRRSGNLSVVLTDNLDYFPRHGGVTRFFQQNPGAEPMTVSCGRGLDAPQSVRSFALFHDGAGYRFSFRHAWFDYVSCRGEMLRAYDTRVTPVARGLAFVYRTTCPTCAEGQRERLHVVMPTMRSVRGVTLTYYTYLTILGETSIEPGTSASIEAVFENEGVLAWNRVLDAPLPTPPFTSLRIEVVRGATDPMPIAQVFTR